MKAIAICRDPTTDELVMLGEARAADVYKATVGGKEVALKTLRVGVVNAIGQDMFSRARQSYYDVVLAHLRLWHPNIGLCFGATAVDMSERDTSGQFNIVLELLQGGSLATKIGTPLSLKQKLKIAVGVAPGSTTCTVRRRVFCIWT